MCVSSRVLSPFIVVFIMICAMQNAIAQEEEAWTWSYTWQDPINGINSGQGEAASYSGAMSQLKAQCGSACTGLKVSYNGFHSGKRHYRLELDPQDTDAEFTDWVVTYPDPKLERQILDQYETEHCAPPSNIRFKGDWYGNLVHQIREKVFTAHLGADCVAHTVGLSTLKRSREIFCSSDGYTPFISGDGICRGQVAGGISGTGVACDCTENLIEGVCTPRDVEYNSAVQDSEKGNYLQLSTPNNEGLSCGIPVTSQSCPAESSLANSGSVGNPIHCADGQKRQHEIDFAAPLGPLMLSRTYLNNPSRPTKQLGSKLIAASQDSGAMTNIQIKAAPARDPSWLINIPRLVKYGESLTGVDLGNGTRLIFKDSQSGIESFGSLYEGDENNQQAIYTTSSGTRYYFDELRRATRKLLPNGQYVDYDYVSEQLTILSDNFGRQLRIEHEEKVPGERNVIGRIRKLIDPAGVVTHYTYNGDGMIESVTNSGIGGTKYYRYEGTGEEVLYKGREDILLAQVIDELGVPYASWEYDEFSRAISSSRNNDVERVEVDYLEYDYENKIATSVTHEYRNSVDALETEYQFKRINGSRKPIKITQRPCEDCVPATTEYTYDHNGLLDKVSVLGGQTIDYDYSSRGLLTKKTVAPGTPEALNTNITWHAEFSRPTRIHNAGLTKYFSYDDNGNLLSQSYGYANDHRVDYTYNSQGQMLTIDGPRTDVQDITRFEYLANGNLSKITNALGHITQITEHDAYGRPTRIVDPNGLVSSLAYNAKGWLLSSAINGDTTQYTYNTVGLLTRLTLPNGNQLSYEYDEARRLVSINDSAGNRINYTVDLYGNRTRTEMADPNGLVRNTVDYAFNNLGQLINTLGANQQQDQWKYDVHGNTTESIDALGHNSVSEFDAINRVVKQIDPDQNITQFEYDRFQQVSKVIDATGKETIYTRDNLGRVTQQVSPDTGKQLFTYDSAGNIKTAKDARGITKTYAYDALNRVISIAVSDNSGNIAHRYDDTTGENAGIGRRTQTTDQSGTTYYQYDIKGQIITESRVIGGTALAVDYEYDTAGLLSAMVYPSGRRITYQRDTSGRVVQINDGNDILTSAMQYMPFGPLTSMNYGNGLSLQRSYDKDYRMQSNTVTSVLGLTYDFTARNNLSAIHDELGAGASKAFTYDTLQRLNSYSTLDSSVEYTHDAIANRLTADHTGDTRYYRYSDNGHQLKVVTDQAEETEIPLMLRRYAVTATFNTSVNYSTPVGEQLLFHCEAGTRASTVRGTDIYVSYSSVCSSAAHAGLLDLGQGGLVTVEVLGSQSSFEGSTNNGITSYASSAYPKSFQIIDVSQDYTNVLVTEPNPWSLTAFALRSRTGEQFSYICPPYAGYIANTIGTELYSYYSSICGAGVHSGVIDPAIGGELLLTMEPGASSYYGTLQNDVRSKNSWAQSDSFTVQPKGDTPNTHRYFYDAAGNPIRRGELGLTYDAFGRIASAFKPGMQASYQYDVNNLRSQKTVNGVTTLYVYDLDGNLIAETDELGNIQREYIYNNGMRLAMIDNGQRYYIHGNHLDAPIALTDDTGTVQWQANVSPYGQMEIVIENAEMNFRFPGQYYDEETGLYYNWNRYYDPETGRYITSDPIGLNGGINTYAYVGGNPLKYTDPTGLAYDTIEEAAIAGACNAYPFSIAFNVEYGGRIIELENGQFDYTPPVTDWERKTVTIRVPLGDNTVAIYHTHGRTFDIKNYQPGTGGRKRTLRRADRYFSEADYDAQKALGKPNFYVDGSGNVRTARFSNRTGKIIGACECGQ